MRASFVCRSCHRRLQSAPARPAGLPLNRTGGLAQLVAGHRSIATTATPGDHNNTRAPPFSLRNGSDVSPPTSQSAEEQPADLAQLAAGSQVMKALTQGAAIRGPRQPGMPRANAKASRRSKTSPKPADEDTSDSRSKPSVKKKEAEAFRARVEAQRKARYFQWGKIRHLYPESELREVKKVFNSWKSLIAQLELNRSLDDKPWIEDGKWLYSLKTSREMRGAWEKLSVEERQTVWQRVMISTLDRHPQAAARVLGATLDPLPPGYAISDVLNLIAKGMKKNRKESGLQDRVFAVLLRILNDLPPGHIPFYQRTWGLFAQSLTADQAARIHEVLKQSNAMLHPNTSLQFARKLAGGATAIKHKGAALEIMTELADGGMDLNQPQPASVITSLLHVEASRQPPAEGVEDFSPTRALQTFMEKGFLPNVVTFTAYMDSLSQRREVAEVVRLAQLFTSSGLKLDTKAYATIFRGTKHSFNAEHARDVLGMSRGTKVPMVDVLNNALHAIFSFSEVEMREKNMTPSEELKPFLPMLQIYAKKFDMAPLQSLIPDSLPLLLMRQSQSETPSDEAAGADGNRGDWSTGRTILPVVDDFAATTGPERLQPNSTTLSTMLRAYIRSLWRPYDLMSLYAYFKSRLTEREHPESGDKNYAAQIVRDQRSLIHDTLILAMMQQPGLTRPALDIFGDMLKDNLGGNAASDGEGDDVSEAVTATPPAIPPAIHPVPTIFTFCVLINGLMRRGETDLAEQVIQIMKENGIDTNVVTWNTQIKWYAIMQNVPRTVGALQGLEAAGFKPDGYTFAGFGKLRDQKRALQMMEKIIDLNKQKVDSRGPADGSEYW
ncbi:PPR repeat [Geosmithia morbida]|uniref:PPR repeat n=1 Tax=Geosmithia morbida TaxID=1094350 RepID=A0A9P4Z2L6_9HYPO|nr:PPR repeat [Geosmithia morbida]KAF4126292.1 PPR repeat [Geosmithia morbida]